MLQSTTWDSHSCEFLVSWTYELWFYDVITSYDVEIGGWICDDVWYWFEWP